MKIYHENIKKYTAQELKLKRDLSRISILRLVIFIFSGIILISLLSNSLIIPFLIVFPVSVVCFMLAIIRYNNLAYQKKHTSFLKRINEAEIHRGECNLGDFDTGERFGNQSHPYTSDLDIFGQHSIFQLINRTTTESGMMLLAEWLSNPAPNNEIEDRQYATKEFSQKLDWSQEFEASGMHFLIKRSDYAKLLEWVKAPVILFEYRLLYMAAAIFLSGLSLLGLFFVILHWFSPYNYVYFLSFISVLVINYFVSLLSH